MSMLNRLNVLLALSFTCALPQRIFMYRQFTASQTLSHSFSLCLSLFALLSPISLKTRFDDWAWEGASASSDPWSVSLTCMSVLSFSELALLVPNYPLPYKCSLSLSPLSLTLFRSLLNLFLLLSFYWFVSAQLICLLRQIYFHLFSFSLFPSDFLLY